MAASERLVFKTFPLLFNLIFVGHLSLQNFLFLWVFYLEHCYLCSCCTFR